MVMVVVKLEGRHVEREVNVGHPREGAQVGPQQGANCLTSVAMDTPSCVLPGRVVNAAVPISCLSQEVVDVIVVGVNPSAALDLGQQPNEQLCPLHVGKHPQTNGNTPLHQHHNGGLVLLPTPPPWSLETTAAWRTGRCQPVRMPFVTADMIYLICFHLASQWVLGRLLAACPGVTAGSTI